PLGVLCTAVAGFVAAQEGIGQDKRNAERYGRTWKFLSKIAEEEDAVREKVKVGDKTALVTWVDRLHEHLSLEHREWRAQGDSVEAVLAEKPKGQAPTQPGGQG
ncbi:MAG: hypothetical protein JHC88_20115, partial [Niveispirillum sp.]|nr:hypothetical protein [Niveispirillum sp.]